MSSVFLRWGIPGFVTVVGGTALSIMMTGENIASDLTTRASDVLATADYGWASVRFDARDAIISGTATDQQMIDAVVARVAAVHGVRSVTSGVVLAEFVSPFPFEAKVDAGGIALSGGVPDETAHARIVMRTGTSNDTLRLMSGGPERSAWERAVEYGLSHLELFDRGEVRLADLNLSISGRAKSPDAYDALVDLDRSGPPQGVRVASLEVEPALASPFEWRASFDGTRLTLSGYTPSEDFVRQLQSGATGNVRVSASLVLASGAPSGFEHTALRLLENLVRLEQGTASISDSSVVLEGAPADEATAAAVRQAMTPGATLTLAPPRVPQYEFTAVRSAGATTLDGFVPDAATRDRLEALDNVDAAGLELARGAPDRFESAVDFVLEMLARMSDGRARIDGSSISIEGRATTVADFTALETKVALGAPQGLILASTDIVPPLADPFVWSAEKGQDGKVRIGGFVPSQRIREALQAATANLDSDSSTLADGSPAEFERESTAALGVLMLLDSGKIAFDGQVWSLSGSVDTPQEAMDAQAAFNAAGLRAAGWTYAVTLPQPEVAAALPIIDPYVWQAQKAPSGVVTLGGFVPADEAKRFFVARAGSGAVDNLQLGAGAPDGFITGALAALDALAQLDEGLVGFTAGKWMLSGQTGTAAQRLEIERALKAAVDTSGWQVTIQARDAAPVVARYTWSATKAADGAISLAGYVTTDELRRFAAVRAGSVARDTTEIASGEPEGFLEDVLAGLDALAHLNMGTAKYADGKWLLAGVPNTEADGQAALAALEAATGAGAGWETMLSAPVVAAIPEPEPAPESEAPAVPAPALEATPETEPPPAVGPEAPAETDVAVAPAPEATPAPEVAVEPLPVVHDFIFEASKALGAPVALRGRVPADATSRWLGVIAGGVPIDALEVGGDLPSDFIPSADAGVRALAMLSDGQLGLEGGRWYLSGRVETDTERAAALANLDALPSTDGWEINVTQLPPIDVCRQKVGAFATRNAILFQSGSARMTEASAPALDELAGYLAMCPEATVHVEGHTDADGPDDLNLVLSVARAEAVVNALIDRGVRADRLYAIGYGESLPIADNGTAKGKQANRRIVFSVLDEHL